MGDTEEQGREECKATWSWCKFDREEKSERQCGKTEYNREGKSGRQRGVGVNINREGKCGPLCVRLKRFQKGGIKTLLYPILTVFRVYSINYL